MGRAEALEGADVTNRQAERLLLAAGPCLGFDRERLVSPDRHKSLTRARHVAMYVARQMGASYPEIGIVFGGRDPTTAQSACRRVQACLDSGDERVAEGVRGLMRELGLVAA